MQPPDTALTRMYNQPTQKVPDGRGGFRSVGVLYKSPIDCLWKTASTEGIRGLYKGAFTREAFRTTTPPLVFPS